MRPDSMISRVTCLTLLLILTTSSSQVSSTTRQDHFPLLKGGPPPSSKNVALRHDDELNAAIASTSVSGAKSRRVRETNEEEDGEPLSSAGFTPEFSPAVAPPLLPQQQHQLQSVISPSATSSKGKGLYPSLSGSGELFRLFRPLAISPDKTIGMTRWYLPGFGYFSRGGRASSNFIRFGRSAGSKGGSPALRFVDDDTGVGFIGKNNAKKKNNFIRLGRENPRQTNFIRLGRSGSNGSPFIGEGEFFNSGYITPALSDPFRVTSGDGSTTLEGRQDFN